MWLERPSLSRLLPRSSRSTIRYFSAGFTWSVIHKLQRPVMFRLDPDNWPLLITPNVPPEFIDFPYIRLWGFPSLRSVCKSRPFPHISPRRLWLLTDRHLRQFPRLWFVCKFIWFPVLITLVFSVLAIRGWLWDLQRLIISKQFLRSCGIA